MVMSNREGLKSIQSNGIVLRIDFALFTKLFLPTRFLALSTKSMRSGNLKKKIDWDVSLDVRPTLSH